MPSWSAMMDENRFRLRASCNACTESKVRCSQRKPTCARCERNETECIYGLSRRTHKDAPPISHSSSAGRVSRSGRPPRLQLPASGETRASSSTSTSTSADTSTGTNSDTTSEIAAPSNACSGTSDESVGGQNGNGNGSGNGSGSAHLFGDYMFPTMGGPDALSMHQHHGRPAQLSLLDFSSLVNGMTTGAAMAPRHFDGTDARDYAHASSNPWALGSLCGASAMHNGDATNMTTFWARNGDGDCTCHGGVTELLATMRGGSSGGSNGDQRLSLDAQLAKLKQCIVASETSMACAHGREDTEPIHIMAVAMLIGYVIEDFKMLARTSSSTLSSASLSDMVALPDRGGTSGIIGTPASTATLSLGGLLEPRLSWGVLELEDDDEMDLRQRLYLLSFRKLERLLAQLTLYLRDLHNARASLPDPSRHMAFVIACDYTRLWLEKKAEDVKRLFSVPSRDEVMDGGLV